MLLTKNEKIDQKAKKQALLDEDKIHPQQINDGGMLNGTRQSIFDRLKVMGKIQKENGFHSD